MRHQRNNIVGPCFNGLQAISYSLKRLAVLFAIAALIVYAEKMIVLGGLVPEQDAYDVRCDIEFRRQGSASPPQIMTRPTARSGPFEDSFRPAIPVVEFAPM